MTTPTLPVGLNPPPLDEDQARVVETFKKFGKVMVEASPGTGKTFLGVYLAVSASRLGWSTHRRKSLFLTFSRNARARIEEEVKYYHENNWAKQDELRSIKVLNYHAFYLEILRKKSGFWGCEKIVKPASVGERQREARELLSDLFADPSILSKATQQAMLAFALKRFDLSDLSAIDSTLFLDTLTLEMLHQRAIKDLRGGRPHYNDFAPLVLNLLEHCPELVDWLRTVYPVVILDEFQDTDLIQWTIINMIRPERVVILLDRFQMIYEWRGSRFQRVNQARMLFQVPDEAEMTLNQIHRVGDEAELARFIQGLRKDKLIGDELPSQTNHGWLVTHPVTRWQNPPPDGWQDIPDQVKCLTEIRHGKIIRFSESTAILTRTNYLADYLYNNLRFRKNRGAILRCRWIGGENSSDESVRDFVWRLRKITNPLQLRGWFGSLLDAVLPSSFLNSLQLRFEDELARNSKDLLKRRRKSNLRALRDSLGPWWDTVDLENYSAIAHAFSEVHSLGNLLLEGEGFLDLDILYYLDELKKATEDFLKDPVQGEWSQFCDHLESRLVRSVFLRLREVPRGLFIMTVHQSKGRQFDHVILPWLSDKGEPGQYHPHKYNFSCFEDRRLLYVALTRARSRVTIIFPEESPSVFLGKWGLYTKQSDQPVQMDLWT